MTDDAFPVLITGVDPQHGLRGWSYNGPGYALGRELADEVGGCLDLLATTTLRDRRRIGKLRCSETVGLRIRLKFCTFGLKFVHHKSKVAHSKCFVLASASRP